jgi:membrane protease YdiL (CAAX protease family)
VKQEQRLILIVGGMFSFLHVPALVVQQLGRGQMILSLLLLLSLGMGNAILMLRTKQLMAPVMAHVLWGATIYLFR